MEDVIGVLAPDRIFMDKLKEIFEEELNNKKIIVEILNNPKLIDYQAKRLEDLGVSVVVARGVTANIIPYVLKIPVIYLRITTLDLMSAIKKASYISKDIYLVLKDDLYFNYEDWKEILNINIRILRYREIGEIEQILQNNFIEEKSAVFVGGIYTCEIAKKLNLSSVYIESRKESIYEAIMQAKEIIKNSKADIIKNDFQKQILNGIRDAAIIIDNNERIVLYNKMAQELLKKPNENVLNNNVTDIFPELESLKEILQTGKPILGKDLVIYNRHLNIYAMPLKEGSAIKGVICSMCDVTKIKSIEKNLNKGFIRRGFVANKRFEDLIFQDSTMKAVIEKAKKIGRADGTVLIFGESGTGKEAIAQSIHNISRRSEAPFVAINCATIPESLLESELFGYEEGAFTGAAKGGKAGLFEIANGGTFFLDEINSISVNLQAKLLRVIEEKETKRIGSDYIVPLDLRIIAATNEELIEKIKDGRFRTDLFYRLSVLDFRIPPLRERKDDILPLFNYFYNELSIKYGKRSDDIPKELLDRIFEHNFMGNVRELRNIVEKYFILYDGKLDIAEFFSVNTIKKEIMSLNIKEINENSEKDIIRILTEAGKTKAEIAKFLGISRTTLWKKVNQ